MNKKKRTMKKKSANQLQTSIWNAAALSIWNDESGNFRPTLRLLVYFVLWLINKRIMCVSLVFHFCFSFIHIWFFPAFTAYFFVSVNSFEKWRWPTLQCSMWPRCYLLHFLFVYSLFGWGWKMWNLYAACANIQTNGHCKCSCSKQINS